MISKNKIKYHSFPSEKKVRDEEQLYVIEGDKLVREYLAFRYQTAGFLLQNLNL